MPTLLARASGRAIPLMLALGLAAGGASAQTAYPTRAISLVVPFAAGGPTDGGPQPGRGRRRRWARASWSRTAPAPAARWPRRTWRGPRRTATPC